MTKAVLFDIDGVLIHYDSYFPATLPEAKYIDTVGIINEYYSSKENEDCDRGKLNIEKEIEPYLQRIGIQLSGKEYLSLQYEFEMKMISYDLLNLIKEIRNENRKVCIASNQSKDRKKVLKEKMGLDYKFDYQFFSCDLGYIKTDNEY